MVCNAPVSCRNCKGAQTKYSVVKEQEPNFKGQVALPCLPVYYLLPGNLKPANKAVHGTNHSKPMESLNFRCTVCRTGTACGIGTVGFLRLIQVLGPSGQEILAVVAVAGALPSRADWPSSSK